MNDQDLINNFIKELQSRATTFDNSSIQLISMVRTFITNLLKASNTRDFIQAQTVALQNINKSKNIRQGAKLKN